MGRDAADEITGIPDIGPADECNIIYSSGIMALPKWIIHDHACREAWDSDITVAFRYHPGTRAICNLGVFSNISWVSMPATLFADATIYMQRCFDVAEYLGASGRGNTKHTAVVPLQFQRIAGAFPVDESLRNSNGKVLRRQSAEFEY